MTLAEVQERIRPLARLIDVETEVPVLHRCLSYLCPGDTYLEIGTWQGCSAIIAALSTPPGVSIWTVDSGEFHQAHWGHTPAEYLAILKANFVKFGVRGRVAVSLKGSLNLRWCKPIHLLFIDGHHDCISVSADLEKWTPFITPAGKVVLHDVTRYEGIRRAIRKWLGDWELVDSGGSIEVYHKPGGDECQNG